MESRPDLSLEQLERTKNLMNSHVRDCLVEGYENLIEPVELPDEDDRHVLAAAIYAQADVILTFNLKDFPPATMLKHAIKAKHPDEFIVSLLESDAEKVCLAAERQRSMLKNPPKNKAEFLETLRQQKLIETCERLEKLI